MENYSYLDNAATTALFPELLETYEKYACLSYGNPSSLHALGKEAARALDYSRRLIADAIGARPGQIIFTSGATEANETFIASALGKSGLAISSTAEHSSVLESLKAHGPYRHRLVDVDENGRLDLEDLEFEMREAGRDLRLVSLIMVNNEIGTVLDYEAVAAILGRAASAPLFHIDATQALGKLEVNVNKLPIDALSASAHKFHGPKGVGFLYVREPELLKPLIHGGGQEGGLRSGTQNLPGICQMAKALSMCASDLKEAAERVKGFKSRILDYVSRQALVTTTIDEAVEQSPYILSLSYPKIPSEVLLHRFEERGILLSSGSACSSNSKKASGVMAAIGFDLSQRAVVRLSFSRFTTEADIERFIRASEDILERTVF